MRYRVAFTMGHLDLPIWKTEWLSTEEEALKFMYDADDHAAPGIYVRWIEDETLRVLTR